ncbi:DUF5131 family protein [Streptomyces anulatus]|uniref:DUF5131 family protein n=1 Tax=Streptomyces anulatus TaxID=1892 RepID=UPI0036525668
MLDEAWVTQIRDTCQKADVAFFFKQRGGRTPKAGGRLLEGQPGEAPDPVPAPGEAGRPHTGNLRVLLRAGDRASGTPGSAPPPATGHDTQQRGRREADPRNHRRPRAPLRDASAAEPILPGLGRFL